MLFYTARSMTAIGASACELGEIGTSLPRWRHSDAAGRSVPLTKQIDLRKIAKFIAAAADDGFEHE